MLFATFAQDFPVFRKILLLSEYFQERGGTRNVNRNRRSIFARRNGGDL
jgi:hypothetical protein